MAGRKNRLSRIEAGALEEIRHAGLQFEVKQGSKHQTLWIEGKPVTAIGGSPSCSRSAKNTRARVRRAIRSAIIRKEDDGR